MMYAQLLANLKTRRRIFLQSASRT